jgi:hypothetical protein
MDRQRRQRAKLDVVSLCHSGLGLVTLFREASARLSAAVPFDRTCRHTLHPATLLFPSAWSQNLPRRPERTRF